MTEPTIPADKVREIIEEMNAELRSSPKNNEWSDGYDAAISAFKARLERLLPKTLTLADELRNLAADYDENGYPEPVSDLSALADRAESLEQERDEAQDMEGRATANLSIQMDRAERLSEQLTGACRRMKEQAAEIARLRARELPNGWRVADHPDHGTVIADPKEYLDGYVMIRYLNENQFGESRPVPSRILSFRDEAPAPQPEGDYITGGLADSKPEGLDPATPRMTTQRQDDDTETNPYIIAREVAYENQGNIDEMAHAIVDALPLVPYISEPTDPSVPEWESPSNKHHAVSVSNHGTVRIWGDTSGYTPNEARNIAYALLAAANHAEQVPRDDQH